MNKISIDIFEDILNSLNVMEIQKKVDLNILEKFDMLIKEFSRFGDLWISEKRMPSHNAFLFYLSSRNCEMILKKMKSRFEEAELKNDNPKVVDDAEPLIPLINDIFIRNIDGISKNQNITPFSLNQIMNSVFSLRELAKKVNMLPSEKDELQGLNKRTLVKEFSKFDGHIGTMMAYEII